MRVALSFSFCIFLAAAVSFGAPPVEDKATVTIPLSEVIGMGQRGLRVLEPDLLIYRDTPEKIEKYSTPEGMEEMRKLAAKSLVVPIERAMDKRQANSAGSAGQGFAVAGRGHSALPGIYDVLVEGKKPTNVFPEGTDISAIFFALKSGVGIQIDSVERTGNVVDVRYVMLVPGINLNVLHWRLAIIPLGKLPPGNYSVQMKRAKAREEELIQPEMPPVIEGAEKGVVAESFGFVVRENR